MWPALIAAGGAALSYIGQQDANRTNAATARYATDRSMEDAQKNRDFQAQMSNTAHQREMKDLEAAGLNPILSGTGGSGASSPAGSTGSAQTYQAVDPLGRAVTSAMEATKLGAELDNMNASRRLTEQQIKESEVNTKVKQKDVPKSDFMNRMYRLFEPGLSKVEEKFGNSAKQQKLYWQTRPDGTGFYGPRKPRYNLK